MSFPCSLSLPFFPLLPHSDTPPAPNIFSRTRRYSSGSFSPLATTNATNPAHIINSGAASPSPASSSSAGPRLTPRVSQLRKEECADISNTREVSHERGLHNQLQISQSWEDLTIVTENWSCRDDLSTNTLLNCPSSPSPTSSRHHLHTGIPSSATSSLRYPFGMSPSPTRKTFATRRSMSPNHVRPSQLCPVKRKFDMDDSCGGGSPPPHKKMFLDVVARGTSPIHHQQHSCASPDSGTYEGRTTPKLFISKLCSSNSLSSFSSASASPTSQLEGMTDAGVDGQKGGSAANSNSNSSSGGGGEPAKEGDTPMVDVSSGGAQGEMNCDKMSRESGGGDAMTVEVEASNDKENKSSVNSSKGSGEPELDDGIGGEEDVESVIVGSKSETQEAESVPVI